MPAQFSIRLAQGDSEESQLMTIDQMLEVLYIQKKKLRIHLRA